MMSAASRNLPEPPAREYIGRVFSQHSEELEWLANFLTGDEKIAAACLVGWFQHRGPSTILLVR